MEKQKITKDHFQKEIETATAQIHRLSGVIDFCKWALENLDFEEAKEEVKTEAAG